MPGFFEGSRAHLKQDAMQLLDELEAMTVFLTGMNRDAKALFESRRMALRNLPKRDLEAGLGVSGYRAHMTGFKPDRFPPHAVPCW